MKTDSLIVDFNTNFEVWEDFWEDISENNPLEAHFSDIKNILNKQNVVDKPEDMFSLIPEWVVFIDPTKVTETPTTYWTLKDEFSSNICNENSKINNNENYNAKKLINQKKKLESKNKQKIDHSSPNNKLPLNSIKQDNIFKKWSNQRTPLKEKYWRNLIRSYENVDIETESSNLDTYNISDKIELSEEDSNDEYKDEDYAPPWRRAELRSWRLKPKINKANEFLYKESQKENIKPEKVVHVNKKNRNKSRIKKKIHSKWPSIIFTILKPNYHFKTYFLESLYIGEDLIFFNERESNIRKSTRTRKQLFNNLCEEKLSINQNWLEINYETSKIPFRKLRKSKV